MSYEFEVKTDGFKYANFSLNIHIYLRNKGGFGNHVTLKEDLRFVKLDGSVTCRTIQKRYIGVLKVHFLVTQFLNAPISFKAHLFYESCQNLS